MDSLPTVGELRDRIRDLEDSRNLCITILVLALLFALGSCRDFERDKEAAYQRGIEEGRKLERIESQASDPHKTDSAARFFD